MGGRLSLKPSRDEKIRQRGLSLAIGNAVNWVEMGEFTGEWPDLGRK